MSAVVDAIKAAKTTGLRTTGTRKKTGLSRKEISAVIKKALAAKAIRGRRETVHEILRSVSVDEPSHTFRPLPMQVAHVLASLAGLAGGRTPLWRYLGEFYTLRAEVASAEKILLARIGECSRSQRRKRTLIYFGYILLRIAGAQQSCSPLHHASWTTE